MTITRKNFLLMILGGVAVLSMATTQTATAGSKDGTKSGATSSAAAATALGVSSSAITSPSPTDVSERKPGPAWKTIGGTLKHIKGEIYTVEDYEGNQVQLHVSRETKQLQGTKKVGDRVRAEITHSGFANSIQ